MASDIVERLRHCSENCGDEYLHELAGRAADTITTLRVENEKLRAELERIDGCSAQQHVRDIARAALAEEKKG